MKKAIALITAVITMSISISISAFAESVEEDVIESVEDIVAEDAEEITIENVERSEELEAQEPRASYYFSSYYYDLEPDDEKGYIYFTSLVVKTNRADKVRVSVQIQKYVDGWGWEDYTGEYIGTSSKASYSFEDRVKVDRGEKYRALFTFEALVNGKVVETKYGSTSGFYAP